MVRQSIGMNTFVSSLSDEYISSFPIFHAFCMVVIPGHSFANEKNELSTFKMHMCSTTSVPGSLISVTASHFQLWLEPVRIVLAEIRMNVGLGKDYSAVLRDGLDI